MENQIDSTIEMGEITKEIRDNTKDFQTGTPK